MNIPQKDGWLYKFVELAQAPQGIVSSLESSTTYEIPFEQYAIGKSKSFSALTVPHSYWC